jgi:hypothetical protein
MTQTARPKEGYAWLITAGDQKLAARLRVIFDERKSGEADRLAADYAAKYGNPRSSASRWVTAAEGFLRAWPGLADTAGSRQFARIHRNRVRRCEWRRQ